MVMVNVYNGFSECNVRSWYLVFNVFVGSFGHGNADYQSGTYRIIRAAGQVFSPDTEASGVSVLR